MSGTDLRDIADALTPNIQPAADAGTLKTQQPLGLAPCIDFGGRRALGQTRHRSVTTGVTQPVTYLKESLEPPAGHGRVR